MPIPNLPHKLWLLAVATDSCILSLLVMWLTNLNLNARVPIWGDFIGLQRSFNDGIAFGLNLGTYQDAIVYTALLLVLILAVKTANDVLEQFGFGFILGGGLANIIDRGLDGQVTDMIQVGSFPVFNIADVCINVGVGLLILHVILEKKKPEARSRHAELQRPESGL